VQTHGPAPPRRPARARGQNAFPKSTHSDSQRDCPWSMLRHSVLDHGANSFRVASFGHTALFMVTDPDAPFRSHCMTRVVALRRRSGLPVKEAGVCRGNQFRTIFRGVRGSAGMEGRTHGKRPRPPPTRGGKRAQQSPAAAGGERTRGKKKRRGSFRFSPHGILRVRQAAPLTSAVNYERFNSSNIRIHFSSWNYRGCWHQTGPRVDSHCSVCVASIANKANQCWNTLLPFLVAASSVCWDWASCVPAASLGCGSRFSGSLSGIEPKIPRYP